MWKLRYLFFPSFDNDAHVVIRNTLVLNINTSKKRKATPVTGYFIQTHHV